MLLERICTYRKGKQTAERKVHRMNEKTRIQIEEMKKQTIGVEVEMYNITREKAARTIASTLEEATAHGHVRTIREENGKSQEIQAFRQLPMTRRQNLEHRFLPTRTFRICRRF